jgi:hypothetical protein
MRCNSRKAGALALAAFCALLYVDARAQGAPLLPGELLNEVRTVAGPTDAVPLEYTLQIAVKDTYQVKLTDLGGQLQAPLAPAPLSSAQLAVTSGSTIVGALTLAGGVGGSTSVSLKNAAVGTYIIHVIGTPGPNPGSGPIGVQVTNSKQQVVATFSGTLAPPPTAVAQDTAVLHGSFTLSTACAKGSPNCYTVPACPPANPTCYPVTLTLTDLSTQVGAPSLSTGTLIAALTMPGVVLGTLPAAGTTTVNVGLGTYDLFGIGQSTAAPAAGLFSASAAPGGGGSPYTRGTTPVGAVALVVSPPLVACSAASLCYTLKLADLGYPNPLGSVGAAVILPGQPVAAGSLTAPGSMTFAATETDTYQVFALGVPSNAGAGITVGTGSYSVIVQPSSGPPAVSVARAVAGAGAALTPFSYDTNVDAAAAGKGSLTITDFIFPSPLLDVSAAIVQGGKVSGNPLNAVGSEPNVAISAGPASLLVFAQAGAIGSLLGLDLTSGGGATVFETTQGVGTLFTAQQITVTGAANYGVTVSDVKWPAPLASLAVVVTQGSTHVGSIYSGGNFQFAATPGNYFVNFIAQPDPGAPDGAGTYALTVGATPVVTLQSSAMAIMPGQTVQLTWSSTNSTGCTPSPASGTFSGSLPASGNATTAVLSTTTKFSVKCTGPGGSTTQSVSVTVAAASSSGGGGGGGDVGLDLLLLLSAVTVVRMRAPTRGRRTLH